MHRNMIIKFHQELGLERVAVLRSIGALVLTEGLVLPVTIEDDVEDVVMHLEQWVDTTIGLTLDFTTCRTPPDIQPSSPSLRAQGEAKVLS